MPKAKVGKTAARAKGAVAQRPGGIGPEALEGQIVLPRKREVAGVERYALAIQHGLTQEEAEELIQVFERSKDLLGKLKFGAAETVSFTEPFPEITIKQRKIKETPFYEIFPTADIEGGLNERHAKYVRPGGLGDEYKLGQERVIKRVK
jgi:hypothetical protein